jgi:hypothetical protein
MAALRHSGTVLLEQRDYGEQHCRGHHADADRQTDYRRDQLKKSGACFHNVQSLELIEAPLVPAPGNAARAETVERIRT